MLKKELVSLQHPLVKHLVKLRTKRSYREEQGKALICGEPLISELKRHISEIYTVVGEDHTLITPQIMKKITGLESPPEVAAEINIPKPSCLKRMHHILVLNGVSDPGNLGTLVRTALALGWEGIYLMPGCCDLFNEKAIRAARGSSFQLPYDYIDENGLIELIEESDFHVFVADGKGSEIKKKEMKKSCLLILGNEGQGVADKIKQLGELLAIPISSKVESLNVAIAGAILMHQLKQ